MANQPFISVWEIPSGKWMLKKPFVGSWRMTELQGFDSEYMDLCGPAKIKFSSRGTGAMNFGAVEMELDCKMDAADENVLHFSFEGGDEGDPICGRGYCLIDGDKMVGRIFRHFGDEFAFRAQKTAKDVKTDQP